MTPHSHRDHRLPSGRHGLSREEVAANQRRRLIGAAGGVLAERGITGVTARLIARRAGVSNQTFYEHFSNIDAILAAGFGVAAQLLVEVVAGACAQGLSAEGVLASALPLGAQEPGLTALMRPEVAVAVADVAGERGQLVRRLAGLLAYPGQGAEGAVRVEARSLAVAGVLALGVERLRGEEPIDPECLGTEIATLLR